MHKKCNSLPLQKTLNILSLLKCIYFYIYSTVLEYASVISDGCAIFDMIDRLEEVQLCATRIVTTPPILA